jgi:hypothetical protein
MAAKDFQAVSGVFLGDRDRVIRKNTCTCEVGLCSLVAYLVYTLTSSWPDGHVLVHVVTRPDMRLHCRLAGATLALQVKLPRSCCCACPNTARTPGTTMPTYKTSTAEQACMQPGMVQRCHAATFLPNATKMPPPKWYVHE